MKILLSLVCLLLPSNIIYSQWIWQNPNQACNTISTLQFINSQRGYAAGRGGMVLRTTNAGIKWENLNAPSSDYIRHIQFIDENNGWLLTSNGTKLFKSSDGGDNWSLIYADSSYPYFNTFYFLNEQIGFAGTSNGVIKTTDSGSTWGEPGTSRAVYDIHFVNQEIGFAAASSGILKTIDGGTTWQLLYIPGGPSGVTAEKVYALDAANVYVSVFGYDYWGEIYNAYCYSNNGGYNWYTREITNGFTDIYFESPTTGWACSGYLCKTTDKGVTWDFLDIKADYIQFKGNDSWISYRNTIKYSTDKWSSITPQIKSVFEGFIWDGYAKDSLTIFACGEKSTILGTFDGGTTWKKYYADTPGVYLYRIIFHDNVIWAVGSGGIILNSTDNGLTWIKNYLTANSLSDIIFINSNIGFAAGGSGYQPVLFKTTNGGVSWDLHSVLNEGSSIECIKFSSSNIAWLITTYKIWKSDDGGETWDTVYNAMTTDLDVSGDTVWFAKGNKVLRTLDAGKTWQEFKIFDYGQSSGGSNRIKFVNSVTGFVTYNDGRVFKTTDAGNTWQDINAPRAGSLFAHTFINEKKGWIFGWPGVIIKYDVNSVGIEETYELNQPDYFLSVNYPNPFNPETKIIYSVPFRTAVSIKVFDVTGREIRILVSEVQEAGEHKITFDGTGLPSGVYFYRIIAGNYIKTNKMVLLK